MNKLKAVCVYCGSNFNGDLQLRTAIKQLAETLVKQEIKLIYGGGSVGVMGLLANDVLEAGGQVIGVIPQFLMDKEVGHTGVTEMIVTENMHQRKQKMADLSDGFVILPGGFGTLEEFFEVLTWLQLGLHNKPIGVLNVDGFYDPLFAQMEIMVQRKFLKSANRDLVFNEADASILIDKMDHFSAIPDEVWFRDRNLS
ncbi:TIGR00730 family Rossman fold protein [Pedobacter sp. HDW13]|uniref:LOG family protein n=1 Tax=unclassified Pedobacter TaxID=2628915 RepID=UPI000F5AA2BC|nr:MULTISPECIES: TIGR00730 family Rossman fold protein [unclassified Pedobacter]QIL42430.1 TIGR00730 family Rossman fold protein [Pedobacter sp. HDW13]RQO78908.1 TIGR00730 family Rossman fold protein [Pedobacter sp. KBW01]